MPDPQNPRIVANVAKMRAQGASDDEVEHYLRDVEGLKPVGQSSPQRVDYAQKLHADYASGALQKRTARVNAAEQANAQEAQANQPGFVERTAANVLNEAQGIPGMRQVEAAAGAPFAGGYQQSLASLDDATNRIPAIVRLPEQAVGATAAGSALGSLIGARIPGLNQGVGEAASNVGGRIVGTIGRVGQAARAGLNAARGIEQIAPREPQSMLQGTPTRLAQPFSTAVDLESPAQAMMRPNQPGSALSDLVTSSTPTTETNAIGDAEIAAVDQMRAKGVTEDAIGDWLGRRGLDPQAALAQHPPPTGTGFTLEQLLRQSIRP